MDALVINDFRKEGIKYLTFSNRDGKQWSIPTKNMRVAMELYEPSGIKGKLLKKLLPMSEKLGVAKFFLRGTYTSLELSNKVREVLVKCFGENWEYSVFWGTPCTDQKITIQIYTDNKILGYCKIGNSKRIKELFEHEKKVLDYLQQKDIQHVPRCLALEQVTDECWLFVQNTEKKPGSTTEHVYEEKQRQFIENLWNSTKESVLFEETDYYQSLLFLERNLNLLDEYYRKSVEAVLIRVKEYYADNKVEWGMSHRDFTPWNTCIVDNKLFVFDFEYALFYAPNGNDQWHFFVQTKHFEQKSDMKQIASEYLERDKERNDIAFMGYLLDVISFYLLRGSQTDRDTAMQRCALLKYVFG